MRYNYGDNFKVSTKTFLDFRLKIITNTNLYHIDSISKMFPHTYIWNIGRLYFDIPNMPYSVRNNTLPYNMLY